MLAFELASRREDLILNLVRRVARSRASQIERSLVQARNTVGSAWLSLTNATLLAARRLATCSASRVLLTAARHQRNLLLLLRREILALLVYT